MSVGRCLRHPFLMMESSAHINHMYCVKGRPQEASLLPDGFSIRCPQRKSTPGNAAYVADMRTTIVPNGRA